MSREIRKVRKQIPKGPRPIKGLYLFITEYDGIVARNLRDAKGMLSDLLGMSIDSGEIKDLGWEICNHDKIIRFCFANSPGWEPQDPDEADDPPYECANARTIIEMFGRSVVYSEEG